MTDIHHTAIVSEDAKIGKNVKIGPYCVIDGQAEIADDVSLASHVVVRKGVKIGRKVEVSSFVILGQAAQHKQYNGEDTLLEIGEGTRIFDFSEISVGTVEGGGVTRIGKNCFVMSRVHVAHDCDVGNNVVLTSGVILAGHVVIGEHAVLSAKSSVLQHCHVGEYAFTSYFASVIRNLPPYTRYANDSINSGLIRGMNIIGLKRGNFSRKQIFEIRDAYKMILFSPEIENINDKINNVRKKYEGSEVVNKIINFFLNHDEKIGISRVKRGYNEHRNR